MRKRILIKFDEVVHEMNDVDDITEEVAKAIAEICESRDIDTEEAEKSMPGTRFQKIFRSIKRRASSDR